MARGLPDREMLYFETAPGEDLPGRVFESRARRGFRDLGVARHAARSRARAGAGVPVAAGGAAAGQGPQHRRAVGLLARAADAFDPEDVELLQTFASQAALAIDTAQLYGREHRVASVLQASILPETLPSIRGLDLASVYRPAGAGGRDRRATTTTCSPRPTGAWSLAIADVAGKGVFAATKTQHDPLLAARDGRGRARPGRGADASSTGWWRRRATRRDIVTVWVGLLDIGDRHLDVRRRRASAGTALPAGGEHRRAARCRQGPSWAASRVPCIGEECVVPMEPGAALMLYTDGVTEARGRASSSARGASRRVLRGGGTAQRWRRG